MATFKSMSEFENISFQDVFSCHYEGEHDSALASVFSCSGDSTSKICSPKSIIDDAVDESREQALENLKHEYYEIINSAQEEIQKQQSIINASALAICKCKENSLLCQLNSQHVSRVRSDFLENGFAGSDVREFLKTVKEGLFTQREDVVKDLDFLAPPAIERHEFSEFIMCNGFKFNSATSVTIDFVDALTDLDFSLSLPIVNNIHFNLENYRDNNLGKYVLIGSCFVDDHVSFQCLLGRKVEFEEEKKKKVVATRQVAAEYSAVKMANHVREYLKSTREEKAKEKESK